MPIKIGLLGALVALCLVLLAGCGNDIGSGSAHWQYTALGDSLAVGVLDSQGGYVKRYDAYITADTGVSVSLTDLGVNGAHSGDLLKSLQNDPNVRTHVSSSQVVTWDIGGDDLLHAVNLFRNGQCGGADNQDCLRSAVTTFMPDSGRHRSADPCPSGQEQDDHPHHGHLQSLRCGTDGSRNIFHGRTLSRSGNQHIVASAKANGVPMAQVHLAFNGPNGDQDPVAKGLITVDGVHPNDNGHKAIADALRALGYGPLK